MTHDGQWLAAERAWADGLRVAAREVLPDPVTAYLEAGAGREVTTGEAEAAWQVLRLVPRVLSGQVDAADTSLRLLGRTYASPVGVAPTAMQRAAHPEGEPAVARAAAAIGAPHVVSSNVGCDLADLAAAGPWWAQVYLPPDREQVRDYLGQVRDAGAEALVLTLDTPFPGPKWGVDERAWDDIDLSWHRRHLPPVADGESVWAADVSVADLEWLAEVSGLPVVAKGVLHPDDADTCVAHGAAAVWVSTHGGRQLDRVLPTARALPDVAAAVDGRVPVIVDGGLRDGTDALCALASGADAVMLGRAVYRGLAVAGEDGVRRLLDLLRHELAVAMALAGAADLAATRRIAVSTWP